jgi:replicative DNA helicase
VDGRDEKRQRVLARLGEVQDRLTRVETREQVARALGQLVYRPTGRPRFAPRTLHDILRYPSRGQLWVVASSTGIGKTTLLLHTVDELVRQAYKIAVLGLEQEDWELRTAFACLRAGVHRAIAVENSWAEHADGDEMYARVQQALAEQNEPPLVELLKLLPQRYITLDVLEEAVQDAAQWGAKIVVVDHIHHIAAGKRSFAEYTAIVQACKRLAEEHEIVMLVAAQVGRRGSFGTALQRYMPAQIKDIEGGDVLAQNANVIFGLYRPLIVPATKEDKARLRMAEKGLIQANEVLRPWRMGVNVMKHRSRGELEGKRVVLRLENGKLYDDNNDDDDTLLPAHLAGLVNRS